jgi:ATP-dependent RNA helicase SUPV3L1/SUV3
LSWREASPGTRPAGAFDGRGFVVTQAMTSLTGSAGEDFASILRALGYRMERRPAPPPKPAVVEPAAAEAISGEAIPAEVTSAEVTSAEVTSAEVTSAESPPETPLEGAAEGAPAVAEALPAEPSVVVDSSDAPPLAEAAASATLLPDVAFSEAAAADEPVAVEPQPVEVPQDQAVAETATETVATVEATASEATAADAGAEAAPVAAPEMVEVWRPGGRSEERRPRHDRSRHRHQGSPSPAAEGAQPAAAANEAGEGAKRERHGRGRRDRNQDFRKPRSDAPAEAAKAAPDGAPVREPRDDKGRPPRERFAGKGREGDKPKGKFEGKFGGGRDKGGRDKGGRDKGGRDKGGREGGRDKRPDGGPSHRPFATSASPRERERPVDPNSPFAKLAALKEQLTANRKDR